MESMDYTSYFTPAPNTFGYLGFGNDANVTSSHGVSSDSNEPIQVRIVTSPKQWKQEDQAR